MPQQAAEACFAHDLAGRRRVRWPAGHRADRHVRPLGVVMVHVLAHDVVQVFFAKDDEVIQALLLDRLGIPLDVSVEVGFCRAQAMDRCTLRFHDRVKLDRELRVQIVDQVGHLPARRFDLEDEVAGLLGDPAAVGARRSGGGYHLPRVHVDEQQDEVVHQPAQRPDLLADEIACPQCVGVDAQELVPRPPAPVRPRVQARRLEDVSDGRLTDVADAQFLEFTEDTGVPPTGLPSDPEDLLANFLGRSRPARFASGPLRGLGQLLVGGPPLEGAVTDDRDQFLDRRADLRAQLDQSLALPLGHGNPPGQLGPEYLVLRFEILNLCDQVALRRVGQHLQEGVEKASHGCYRGLRRVPAAGDRVFEQRRAASIPHNAGLPNPRSPGGHPGSFVAVSSASMF